MNRDQIKLKHCYSMTPIKGRRTIAWVTELFRIAAMAAYQEEGTETLELNPIVVRFVSRHAAYPTGWSTRRQQLLIEDFALAAEKEVSGHLARRSRRPGQSSNWTPAFPCGTTNRQQLAYVYYEDEPGRRSAAKVLSNDEARRIAACRFAEYPFGLRGRSGYQSFI